MSVLRKWGELLADSITAPFFNSFPLNCMDMLSFSWLLKSSNPTKCSTRAPQTLFVDDNLFFIACVSVKCQPQCHGRSLGVTTLFIWQNHKGYSGGLVSFIFFKPHKPTVISSFEARGRRKEWKFLNRDGCCSLCIMKLLD